MKDRIAVYLGQIQKLWGALSTSKRIALVVLTLAVGLGVLAVSFYGSRETYGFLFTELSLEDAGAIAAKLKEMKVPYKLDHGGTAILVAEDRVHELRLDLAGQGLPRGGGVGFEIFDKSHLGATEFEQRINLRRALEGELSRTIGTIAAVQAARVHLVLPERSVFAIASQEASASVVLKLRPGRTFGKGEVSSVVHLVASAVPGLGPERVSVVSADGLMLHRPKSDAKGAGELGAAGDGGLDLEREIAAGLEDRARALLERVVGAGHADVRIGITLDTATRERTEEHYEPSKTALRSEQKSEERSGVEPERVAGVPGADSNLPGGTAEPGTPTVGGAGATRTNLTRNWEIDRVTEKTATPPGRLARLTVAALVDGTYKTGAGGREFVPRDKAELDRLAELVKGAVGFETDRGDFLQIECARFAGTDEGDVFQAPAPTRLKRTYYYIAAAAAAALVLALVVLVWRGRNHTVEIRELKLAAAATHPAIEEDAAAPRLGTTRQDPAVVRTQALEIAAKDPATAAVILRGWLNAPAEP